jgi:hypothetical protein
MVEEKREDEEEMGLYTQARYWKLLRWLLGTSADRQMVKARAKYCTWKVRLEAAAASIAPLCCHDRLAVLDRMFLLDFPWQRFHLSCSFGGQN